MAQDKFSINETAEWTALQHHWEYMQNLQMRDLFANDPSRLNKFSLSACDLYLDYSKNLIDEKGMELLFDLAETSNLTTWGDRLLAGDKINTTEGRAVLHMALRNIGYRQYTYEGRDIMPDITSVLSQMRDFSDGIRDGSWVGFSGKKIKNIISIGIGGSSLGPRMVCEALRPYQTGSLNVQFISNIDSSHITQTLAPLDPERTLFIVSSKTFLTQETITNALSAKDWLINFFKDKSAIEKHFIAISTNKREVVKFGIDEDNIFEFWDWVGGRYSLWSAIGLPIALAIGMDNFEKLLLGAQSMDRHFVEEPPEKNMPIILALLGIWYTNFGKADSYAVIPYDQNLRFMPEFLQQLDMESNGKCVTRDGLPVSYHTGPIVWGAAGTDAQHSFFQSLHQGTRLIPTDFIFPLASHNPVKDHHEKLVANCLAQAQALMRGRTREEAIAQMKEAGVSNEYINKLLPHRVFPGNRPSNILAIEKITPQVLGSMIALYEHKVFVQGIVWGVDSFDNWGVELGKQLAGHILQDFNKTTIDSNLDSSTASLLRRYQSIDSDDKKQ